MTIKRGDDGPHVTDVQKMLIACGYELPRYGADGDAGDETLGAFRGFMSDHGPERDANPLEIDDGEIELLRSVFANASEPLPEYMIDRRQHATRLWDRGPRGGRAENSWGLTRGTMVHQTAANMGASLARYNAIGCHLVILRDNPPTSTGSVGLYGFDGAALFMHELDRYIVHGHGGNSQCVGIEIVGTFEGVQGQSNTLWRPRGEPNRQANRPTTKQLETLEALVPWIKRRIESHGGKMHAIFPHRVASGDRESDPGSETWQTCTKIRDALGLTDGGPGFVFPDDQRGMPIPESWDSTRIGIRYR